MKTEHRVESPLGLLAHLRAALTTARQRRRRRNEAKARASTTITRFGPLALLALIASGLGVTGARGEERANCGYRTVEVAYADHADLGAACDALGDTVAYFRRIDFRVDPKVSVSFGGRHEDPSAERPLTHGEFDSRALRIVVYPRSSLAPWGLHWNARLAASFLRHELVHMAVWQIIGGDPDRLPREWHEFIAYAVQLELMDQALRGELLAKAADVRPFATLSEVNEITYGLDPDVFAVAAYRTYRERGAEAFVRQLLRAEITPPRLPFPFAVPPDQRPSR